MGKSLRSQEIADANELLDIGQAAAFLNVSEASLRRWTNSGRLPCMRVGQRRERRFRREDLVGFLESGAPRADGHAVRHSGKTLENFPDTPVTVTHGSHLCGMYASDLGRITLSVPFLLDGLNEGSVCFLVGPTRFRNEILKGLKQKRAALQADIDAGRLILSEYHHALRAQNKYFRAVVDDKIAQGVQSFRIIGDAWGMRAKVSEEFLVEYEADYDRLIARKYPVVTLCLYDARRFSGVEMLNALKGHRDSFRYPLERALA
ncbi:MAG TPA: MEDS domain-containing protein [Gemmatimonadaceae bacterium]|nr:MEDS domain-containing protein [Gemmatimonadaceae bacterium]